MASPAPGSGLVRIDDVCIDHARIDHARIDHGGIDHVRHRSRWAQERSAARREAGQAAPGEPCGQVPAGRSRRLRTPSRRTPPRRAGRPIARAGSSPHRSPGPGLAAQGVPPGVGRELAHRQHGVVERFRPAAGTPPMPPARTPARPGRSSRRQAAARRGRARTEFRVNGRPDEDPVLGRGAADRAERGWLAAGTSHLLPRAGRRLRWPRTGAAGAITALCVQILGLQVTLRYGPPGRVPPDFVKQIVDLLLGEGYRLVHWPGLLRSRRSDRMSGATQTAVPGRPTWLCRRCGCRQLDSYPRPAPGSHTWPSRCWQP